MKQPALALAFLLVVAPASGGEPFPRYGNLDSDYRAPMELDRLAALLGDDVLRDMVCRISYERYTMGSLSSALGMPEGQVMRRINTLRGWGLVRMVRRDSAHTLVEPLPGDGAQTLRRWANRYCSEGDACGVPVTNPENQRPENQRPESQSSQGKERMDVAASPGGAAPRGGDDSAVGGDNKGIEGTVKWFSSSKGFGFIERKDGMRDVFVHRDAVLRSGLADLREGQKVTFDVVPGRGGRMAADNLAIIN